jgi:hypothetical protein
MFDVILIEVYNKLMGFYTGLIDFEYGDGIDELHN